MVCSDILLLTTLHIWEQSTIKQYIACIDMCAAHGNKQVLLLLSCACSAHISSSVDASHDLVSPSRATKLCSQLGGRYSGHSSIMWCTVCSG